jgi:hypothetical protein
MKRCDSDLETPSFWQLVFAQSKVNGAAYTGEQLQGYVWNWPRDTFLQRRLRQTRWYPESERSSSFN